MESVGLVGTKATPESLLGLLQVIPAELLSFVGL